MYELIILEPATAASYDRLTYPMYRPYLRSITHDGPVVALGVHTSSQPVGLALARFIEKGTFGEILSLFVVPEHRQYGLGKALLTGIEKELFRQGCLQVNLDYVANATSAYLERILEQRNWSNPKLRMLVCSGAIMSIKDAHWLNLGNTLPSSYEIFPWLELTLQERKTIQEQQNSTPWYPDSLSPFSEEGIIEPMNSLGLRYQDQVIGWMITHRLAVDTVRYTSLFVRQDLQRIGRAIPLLAKAINLQLESTDATKEVFTVMVDNTPMIKFVQRRLAPYLSSIRQSWGTSKLLGSDVSKQSNKLISI